MLKQKFLSTAPFPYFLYFTMRSLKVTIFYIKSIRKWNNSILTFENNKNLTYFEKTPIMLHTIKMLFKQNILGQQNLFDFYYLN